MSPFLSSSFLPWKPKKKHNTTVIQLVALPTFPPGTEYATVWQGMLNEHLAKLKPKDLSYMLKAGLAPGLNEDQLNRLVSTLEDSYGKKYSSRALQKVHPIVSHIQSFGRVVDTMVQSNPEIAALIWGGVRLLMEISARAVELHERVLDGLQVLSFYLSLFERWRRLFPEKDYVQLSACMRETCQEFVGFLVKAVRFLRKNALTNTLCILFRPSFQAGFKASEKAIKRQTDFLAIEVSVAGHESSKKDNQKLQYMMESSLAAQHSQQSVQVTFPFRFIEHCVRNDSFFGRDNEITELETILKVGRLSHDNSVGRLSHDNSRLSSVVVHGLGGLGKSSVALEYFYRHYNAYPVIIWLYAEKKDSLDTQFVRLARLLGLPVDSGSINNSGKAVLHWMTHLDVDWLMVFDNADDISALTPYWPSAKHGSIIITSRNTVPGIDAFATKGLQLSKFSVQQGIDFLLSLLTELSITSQEDMEATKTVSEQFDGLPLGLRQAASFMRAKKCRPVHFLELYNRKYDDIEQTQIPGYSKTVANVWDLSMSVLTTDALSLLDVLTLLDPDVIPIQLLRNHGNQGEFTAFLEDLSRYLDATSSLADQSFIEIKIDDDTLSLHRFFQEATFRRLRKDAERFHRVYSSTVRMVNHALPEDDFLSMKHVDAWPIMERFLGHVNVLWAKLSEDIPVTAIDSLLMLTTKVAGYFHESGRYNKCDRWLKKAQDLAERINGVDPIVLSKMLYYRGRWAQESNQQDLAVEAFEKATHIYETKVGTLHVTPENTYLPILYQNMGMSYTGAERFQEAERYLSKGLTLAKQPGSACRVVIGDFFQCLGACHLWNGDLAKAEDVLCRALLEKCGENDENRGGALYTLGNVYLRQSRYWDALQTHKKVLKLYTDDLGENHHWVADSCHKVGSILAIPNTGITDLIEAEQMVRRSKDIWDLPANVADPHSLPCAARSKWKLARILFAIGDKLEEAQSLQEYARTYVMDKLGKDIEHDEANAETVMDNLVFYWSR